MCFWKTSDLEVLRSRKSISQLVNWLTEPSRAETLYESGNGSYHVNTIFMLFGWFLRESQSNVLLFFFFVFVGFQEEKSPRSAVTRWRIMALVYTRHLLLHTAPTGPTVNTAKLLRPLPSCPAVACCTVQTSSDGGRRSSDPTAAPGRCFSSAPPNPQLSRQPLTQFILAALLSIKKKTGREELWHTKTVGVALLFFFFSLERFTPGWVWGRRVKCEVTGYIISE